MSKAFLKQLVVKTLVAQETFQKQTNCNLSNYVLKTTRDKISFHAKIIYM